jgi:GTP-binding protein
VKLLAARFVTSATTAEGIPRDGVPHVAIVGRSNVGKSSLINALAKGRALARTSGAAGKTRLANLYRFDLDGGPGGAGRWSVCLVDLPGYGYARGGRESVAELRKIAEAYFSVAHALRPADTAGPDPSSGAGALRAASTGAGARYDVRGVLHVVDARHPALDADVAAAAWVDSIGTERAVIATKIDKLTRAERAKNLGELTRQLGTAPLPFSAASGEGLDDLWTLIARLSR